MLESVDPHPRLTEFARLIDATDWTSREWVRAAVTALDGALLENGLTAISLKEQFAMQAATLDFGRCESTVAALETVERRQQWLKVYGRRFMELREEFRPHWDR